MQYHLLLTMKQFQEIKIQLTSKTKNEIQFYTQKAVKEVKKIYKEKYDSIFQKEIHECYTDFNTMLACYDAAHSGYDQTEYQLRKRVDNRLTQFHENVAENVIVKISNDYISELKQNVFLTESSWHEIQCNLHKIMGTWMPPVLDTQEK